MERFREEVGGLTINVCFRHHHGLSSRLRRHLPGGSRTLLPGDKYLEDLIAGRVTPIEDPNDLLRQDLDGLRRRLPDVGSDHEINV